LQNLFTQLKHKNNIVTVDFMTKSKKVKKLHLYCFQFVQLSPDVNISLI